jgi:hypothetical protein
MKECTDLMMPAKLLLWCHDAALNQFFLQEIKQVIRIMNKRNTAARILCLGSSAVICAAMGIKEGAESATCVTPSKYLHSIFSNVVKTNNLQDKVTLLFTHPKDLARKKKGGKNPLPSAANCDTAVLSGTCLCFFLMLS